MIKGWEYSITPAFDALPGDVLERGEGTDIHLRRNGAIVATSTLGPPVRVESGDITTKRVISSVFEAEEIILSHSITISDVTHNADGSKTIHFPNGSATTYQPNDFDLAVQAVQSDEWIMQFVLARFKSKSPTLASDTSISGKTFEVNEGSDLAPLSLGVV